MFRRVIRAANNDSVMTRDTFSAATCSLRKKVTVAPDSTMPNSLKLISSVRECWRKSRHTHALGQEHFQGT